MKTNFTERFSLVFFEYDQTIDKYVEIKSLDQNQIISYEYTAADFSDYDEFTCNLKKNDFTFDLVPQNEDDFQKKKPLIIGKRLFDSTKLLWFSFINYREYMNTLENGESITFNGNGFTYFNGSKIVNANTNYNNKGETLPDDFGMYVSTNTFDNHIKYLYNVYQNPLVLTYGKRSTVKAPHRKFKGLGKVNVNVDNKAKSRIRFEQKSIDQAMAHICDVMGQEHVTKQSLVDGKIVIDITKPKFIDEILISDTTDISERMYRQKEKVNFLYAYGYGNNSANVYKNTPAYFTTIETDVDLSFIGKQNNSYVLNTAKTLLSQRVKARVISALKIISNDFFTKLFIGDCLKIENTNFRITTIKEMHGVESGLSYDVELTLVDDNGKKIIVDTDENTDQGD